MKTKEILFVLALLGALQNIKKIPDDLHGIIYVCIGMLFFWISDYITSREYKWFFRYDACIALIVFCDYLSKYGYAKFCSDYSAVLFFLVAACIAERTYLSERSKHRSNLLLQSELLMNRMYQYIPIMNNKEFEDRLDFSLFIIEMDKTQKSLRDEILASTNISDFSLKSAWDELKYWYQCQDDGDMTWKKKRIILSNFRKCINYSNFCRYTKCKEYKIAETVGAVHGNLLNDEIIRTEDECKRTLDNIKKEISECKSYRGKELEVYSSVIKREFNKKSVQLENASPVMEI